MSTVQNHCKRNWKLCNVDISLYSVVPAVALQLWWWLQHQAHVVADGRVLQQVQKCDWPRFGTADVDHIVANSIVPQFAECIPYLTIYHIRTCHTKNLVKLQIPPTAKTITSQLAVVRIFDLALHCMTGTDRNTTHREVSLRTAWTLKK